MDLHKWHNETYPIGYTFPWTGKTMEEAARLRPKDDVASSGSIVFLLPRWYWSPKEAEDIVADKPITNSDITSNNHPDFPSVFIFCFTVGNRMYERRNKFKIKVLFCLFSMGNFTRCSIKWLKENGIYSNDGVGWMQLRTHGIACFLWFLLITLLLPSKLLQNPSNPSHLNFFILFFLWHWNCLCEFLLSWILEQAFVFYANFLTKIPNAKCFFAQRKLPNNVISWKFLGNIALQVQRSPFWAEIPVSKFFEVSQFP